jgi:tetratricopeptide (TPR) repeat protein
MKKILALGLYGALIGAILGIAILSATYLLSDSIEYQEETIVTTEDSKSVSYDDRNSSESKIVIAFLKLGEVGEATKFFNSIDEPNKKWGVLYFLVRDASYIYRVSEGQINEKNITSFLEFILKLMPTDDNEKRLDLLISIGNQYLEIQRKEEAKALFNNAAELLSKIKTDNEASESHNLKYSAQKNKINKANSYAAAHQSASMPISLGKIVLVPIFFGALGFIFSVILKPALEAFGRTIIAPAIAKIIRSDGMMKEVMK